MRCLTKFQCFKNFPILPLCPVFQLTKPVIRAPRTPPLKVGESREFIFYRTKTDDEFVFDEIYAIDGKPKKPVQYTTDQRCQLVGEFQTKAPAELETKRMYIKTRIEFGGTEIKVTKEFIGTDFKSSTTVNFF